MGIIRVETPQGIVRVEIEGNEPTEEEISGYRSTILPSTKTKKF